jgi:hypothetical protein
MRTLGGTSVSDKTDIYWPAGGLKPLQAITSAGWTFVEEHGRLLDFAVFFSDAGLKNLKKFLTPQGGAAARDAAKITAYLEEYKHHELFLGELTLCRVIDTYLQYLTNLLALIYRHRPEMLHSSEQERIDFVLSFSSMEELRAALAEKRVEKLSFLAFKDLCAHLEKHTGFSLFLQPTLLEDVALLVEYRNIFVHSAGKIGSISARRFPSLSARLGERLSYTMSSFRPHRQALENSVFDIDTRAASKFGLPTTKLPEPPEELVG